MKTTLKLIIALVLAGAGIGQAWADAETHDIGHITYTEGEDDHGTLSFHNSQGLNGGLSTGAALDANGLEAVKDDNGNVVGYRVYIYAQPEAGYTAKGMTLEAELTTTVMQSRRNKAADSDESFDIGQKLTISPVEGKPNFFEMVMPDDPNLSVNVTAKFAPMSKNKEPISYIDADGETQTKKAGDVYVMDGTEIELEGWYVCNSSFTYDRSLKAVGDVHLILADEVEMSVETDMDNAIDLNEKSLTIYGQSTGADMGSLNVTGGGGSGIDGEGTVTINGGVVEVYGNVIGIAAGKVNINGGSLDVTGDRERGILAWGTVTINGGKVDVKSNSNIGIAAENVTINGGNLKVSKGFNGIDAMGTVTINGGVVDVYGNRSGIVAMGTVTINGGKVTADSNDGDGIESRGDITLGWNSADDQVYAKSYYIYGTGSVKIADGKVLKYTDGNKTVTLRGTLDAAAIAGKTLTPYGYSGYCGKASVNGGKNVVWEILAEDNANTTNIDESKTLNIIKNADVTGQTDFSMADYVNNDASVAGNFAPWIKPSANGKYSDGLKYESVTAVNIGEGVISIGKKAFENCGGLTSVTIGKDVTTIGGSAFDGCGHLTSVTIGEGVNTIGQRAFMGCGQLTSVNIPASVATIDDGAFSGCGQLSTVTIPASVTEIGNYAFSACGGLTTVTVNRYVSDDGENPITNLGSEVFTGCNNLKLILLPDEAAYDAYYGSEYSGWNKYKAMLAPQTLKVAKNASGWSTYCHRFPVSYSLSEGATAYMVTGLSEDGRSVSLATADVDPCVPLLLNYVGGEGDVTMTAVTSTATTVEGGDILSIGEGCTISGNMTGRNLQHTAANDGIPALTGVEGQTSYALYNGNLLRIDTDKGIDGHRWVLTVNGAACPDVIALSTAEVTPGDDGGIGCIVYSQSHGTLSFFKDGGLNQVIKLTPGTALSTDGLKAVKDDNEKVVGYLVYVYAKPEFGYTVNGKTLQAELTTSVQQSRRFDSDNTNTLKIGRAIELKPIEGKPYIFTMVMPNDPNINVSVTATFAAKATNTEAVIEYIDADGATKEKEKGSVYVLDGTEEELAGWYVCESSFNFTYKRRLKAVGDVHLILADGAKMSVETPDGGAIDLSQKSLTIYGQSTGTGSLTVFNKYLGHGIGAGGTVTINGGVVNVYGYYTGIAAGNVTINGGNLNVTGDQNYGIDAGGTVTINGGGVQAAGYYGIRAGEVNINGGKVMGGGNGIYSGGDITLGWNSTDDKVWTISYISGTGCVKIADGKVLEYTDNNSQTVTLRGTLDAATIAAIGWKNLTPYGYGGYCGKADVNGGKNVVWEILAEDDATTTIDESKTLNIKKNADVTGQTDFSMADHENYNGDFAPWIKPNAEGNFSAGLKYESVTAVNIGDGVTSIGKNAFMWCEGLTSVTIGEGVTTIGESAFDGCDGLTSVTIGEDVTTIGEGAFRGCEGLTSVNIPASVNTIGHLAFGDCGGLTSVNIPASVTTIDDNAFTICYNLTTVTVNRYGSGITTLGENVFLGCGKLKLILVPDEAAYDAYYGSSDDKGWGEYKDKLAPQTLTVAKNASGWGTYCHRFPVSYSVEGATAYTVNRLSDDGKSVEIEETAAAAPATPLLLNYEGGEGDVTLTAVPGTATTVKGDMMTLMSGSCTISGNMTGSKLTHTEEDDGIPALTGVADQTSYALYNGNFLRIDTDNGIEGHHWVFTVKGAASPDVIALTTAMVTPGTGGIGSIVYSKGEDDNGKLEFYASLDDLQDDKDELDLEDLNTNVLEVVKDDKEKVVGYRIYVYAKPEEGYTVNGMKLKAELTTSVQQSRRFDSDDNTTLQIGRAIGLTPIEGKPYIFTMVMPNDPNINVTVTATFEAKAKNEKAIEYIDADGAKQTKEARSVYVLDGTEEVLGGDEAWYVCNSTLSYKGKLKVRGDVHLILADGAAMSVEVPDGKAIDGGLSSLTIYGQSKGTGRLNVSQSSNGIDAGGPVTINGGVVDVYGSSNGIVAGSVNINGGVVEVNGNRTGISAGNVNINGGKVTATGTGENGVGIYSDGDITLGWNSATDYITAKSYETPGYVRTADGKMLKYTDGNKTVTLRGTLDAATIAAIADKELTPYGYGGYCGKDKTETTGADESKDVKWEIPLVDGAPGSTLTISGTGDMADYENYASNLAPWIKPNANGIGSDGLKYESVTAVNIGDGVTYIGQNAFYLCLGLKSVTIGENVTTIGVSAFNGCRFLTSVTIGEGVNTIGEAAFMGCDGITSVTIPASVATIGNAAFNSCGRLTTVNIPASVTNIGYSAFRSCGRLTTVTVKRYVSDDENNPITTLGNGVFDDCENLKLILVPNEAAYNEYYKDSGWGSYKDKLAPQKLTVAKNASGWSTYGHRFPVSYSLSEGAKAYKVKGMSEDGNSVEKEEAIVELEDNVVAAAAPATPLLLNYVGGEGSVTLTAVPATATTMRVGDIVGSGDNNCILIGNMTGSTKKHAAEDDGIPALTGVAGQTSYALYNGNFLRIDTDNGIDGHRCVLIVYGDAIPDVIALSTAEVTTGTGGGIGSIVYSKGEDDNGKLEFYASLDDLQDGEDELDLGELDTNVLEAVKDDNEKVVGYCIYVLAKPDKGYTVNGMTLKAELTTSVQQSRRFDSDDAPTLQIGRAIELTPKEGKPYIFTMVMPNDPNINATVNATFEEKATKAAIEYIDANGAKQTKEAGTVYVLDGTEEKLGLDTAEEGVWYVCNSKLDYEHTLKAVGDVHLILADGAAMSVEVPSEGSGIDLNQKSLTIYGQSTGTGAGSLTVKRSRNGIGAGGSVTINGGRLEVFGGIGAGIDAGGTVTINGGKVTANGTVGIVAGNVNINGGNVSSGGKGIESGGDITLGWNSASDKVSATSYHSETGSVKIADGKVLKYTDGNSQTVTLRGTLDAATIAAIKLKMLTPYGYGGYCGKDNPETTGADESKNVTWEIPLENGAPGSTLTISGTGEMADYKNTNASVAGNFAPWLKPNAAGNASDGLKYESVTAVNIGDGVTSIGKKAFFWCIGVTSVTIGKGVTTIGEDAFFGCGGLTTVTIGEGVNTIGHRAFNCCGGLTSVNIPVSVATIDDSAFGGCGGLTTVTVNRYGSGITTLGNGVFDECRNLTLILVPNEAAYDEYYDGSGWGDYKDKLAPKTMTLAKNASGWGTYCHRFPVSYSVDGATAHTVTGLSEDGRSVSISSALAAVAPATPLLLNYGSTGSVTLTAVPATVTKVEDGIASISGTGFKFYGNPTAEVLGAADCSFINAEGYNSYMLYDGEFVRIDQNKGLAAHRCVLNVANGDESAARVLTIADGEATGIESLTPDHAPNSEGSEGIFTLDGRRVGGKPAPGIYVRNGKKVVIK